MVLRPGFEETEENLTNLMESRLQDHERIRGGLYFIQTIPRDENWKVRRDILASYEPKKAEDCTLNVSAGPMANLAQQIADSPKLAKRIAVQELEKQPNGTFVSASAESPSSPRAQRRSTKKMAAEMVVENRRGSMDCILEDSVIGGAACMMSAVSGMRGGRRASRIPSGSRGSSRRGSVDSLSMSTPAAPPGGDSFSYWLKVQVNPMVSGGIPIKL